MKNELSKLYDSLSIPAEADERIREALLRRSANRQEVTPMKRKHHPIRTLLIAAALVAALAIAVAAVAQTSFRVEVIKADLAATDSLQSALGDSIAGQEAYTLELIDKDGNVAKTESYPSIERVVLDEEKAVALLGNYVYAGTAPIVLDGCTLDVAGFMLDESGIGIVTVDIDFPSTDMVPDAYSPCLSFYSGTLTDGEAVKLDESNSPAELAMYDCADYRDETRSTDTHIRYVCYLTPFDCEDKAGNIVMRFRLIDQVYDTETSKYTGEGEWYIALSAPTLIPAQRYSGDGFEAWVSPIGIKLETAGGGETILKNLSLCYADGSDYTVKGDGSENLTASSLCHDYNHHFYAFNRLADTASLESITLGDMTLSKAQ